MLATNDNLKMLGPDLSVEREFPKGESTKTSFACAPNIEVYICNRWHGLDVLDDVNTVKMFTQDGTLLRQ